MSKKYTTIRKGPFDEVYRWVRRIPAGRVMNYGQISNLLSSRLSARAVGWAMRRCPDDVPWHRVVNARGGCSTDSLPHLPQGTQKALLQAEGVHFDKNGNVDMQRCRWRPAEPGREES
ncbi:MAG TPA: MGMT family protein [Acidobacteriota bacterium]|nr:MGMT family protein [Acidobacteriota bacterium]